MRPRDLVAIILASSAGLSTIAITVAGLWDAVSDPRGVSATFASLITGTLGVLVGALAGYIGGRHEQHDAESRIASRRLNQPQSEGDTDGRE